MTAGPYVIMDVIYIFWHRQYAVICTVKVTIS